MAMQSGFIKRIRDIMRMDAGINGDAQRIEQMVWMLFLKVYDAKEDDWALNEDDYESIIPEALRWRNWAKADSNGHAMTGDKLLNFVNNILFPVLLDYQKPDRAYLEELLTVLNLKDRRKHLPSQLSGGQQQRVAIGRALMTRPSLILADEPTGNLDTQNTSEVIALLKETSRKYEQTILMITHNRSIAQTADRVLQVSDGCLTDFGRCRE